MDNDIYTKIGQTTLIADNVIGLESFLMPHGREIARRVGIIKRNEEATNFRYFFEVEETGPDEQLLEVMVKLTVYGPMELN